MDISVQMHNEVNMCMFSIFRFFKEKNMRDEYILVLFECGKAAFDYYFTDDIRYTTMYVGIDRYNPRTWDMLFHVLSPNYGEMDGKRYQYRVLPVVDEPVFKPTHKSSRHLHGAKVEIPVMIKDGVGYDEWGSSDGRPTLAWDGKRWRTLLYPDRRKPNVVPLPPQ